MQWFFGEFQQRGQLLLPTEEAKHLIQVMRKKVGDKVLLCNGNGLLAESIITNMSKHDLEVDIQNIDHIKPRSTRFHLAIAPTKNIDRIEWMLEKCVEMGLEEISFIITEHSERRVLKLDRLHRLVQSAAKQSKQAWFTKINGPIAFKDWLPIAKSEQVYIASQALNPSIWDAAKVMISRGACVLIGPEGDFSSQELELAMQHRCLRLSLGNSRLRTETAGLQACAWWSFIYHQQLTPQ